MFKKAYLCEMKIFLITDIDAFDETFIEMCASFFPEWRKKKMLRFRHLKDKIKNGLAYLLLIYALKEEGVFKEMPEFEYNEHGKPFLTNYPNWYFSLSHCRTAVCCVLSNKEVGIDIEKIASYKESLANYVCNAEELVTLQNSKNKANEFYRLWTRKEAVFKMFGSGITKEIKDILYTPNTNVESHNIGDLWVSISCEK